MTKLVPALLAALLLTLAASAQSSQDLPSAPSAAQPRFPGAPAQPPQKPVRNAPVTPGTPGDAAQLTTLPPANGSPDAAATDAAPERPRSGGDAAASVAGDGGARQPHLPGGQPQAKPAERAQSGEYRIGVDVDLVDLIFTATDKHGRFIKV